MRGSSTFSRAVVLGRRWKVWKTNPIFSFLRRASSSGLKSSTPAPVQVVRSRIGSVQETHDVHEGGFSRSRRARRRPRTPRLSPPETHPKGPGPHPRPSGRSCSPVSVSIIPPFPLLERQAPFGTDPTRTSSPSSNPSRTSV